MEEVRDLLKKYDESYIAASLHSVSEINRFAGVFFKDVADVYDAITRVKNLNRNPNGFSLDDAPILGLLVRVWKLLKEMLKYYEADNAEIISILERPVIEAAVTATYLLQCDANVLLDYRKCSYKDRLRILADISSGSRFSQTKAGQRLAVSICHKMRVEGLTVDDFDAQRQRRWRLQGKPFAHIFSEVVSQDLYACTYGMMSESIHGSWNESLDYDLLRKDDGCYSAFPFYQPADVRFVTPTIRFCNPPFRLWLKRIEATDPYLLSVLDWIDRVNVALFKKFDQEYDG